ncbi:MULTISPECIES: dihydrofolate reductase family protein [unclassified Thioalkalivibrio]|uniref:RibD family protein n=2 Tax=unclassified Thioalkalivibrio TaxID=2621013 RepID=UPI0009D91DCD
MINTELLQLYPAPSQMRSVLGLYLGHRLHLLGTNEKPFVYGNFIASMDGRVALGRDEADSYIPEAMGSAEDIYLLQELEAQSDCIIVHGAYLRALAAGRLGNILKVGIDPDTRHLLDWRVHRGLKEQPDIVIVSSSLDFPTPQKSETSDQRVIVATGKRANSDRVKSLRSQGFDVWAEDEGRWVDGAPLVKRLGSAGYRSIYLLAGPRVLASMVYSDVLSRLYLTASHCLLGGSEFHTMFRGPTLPGLRRFRLESLFYQLPTEVAPGQFFTCFSREHLAANRKPN